MAHLWFLNGAQQWTDSPLPALALEPLRFGGDGPAGERARQSDVRLLSVPVPGTHRERWALIAPPSARVRVNGGRVTGGMRELADRDEIALDPMTVCYFSTERVARVEPFGFVRPDVGCPRCTLAIEPGMPSVRCPQCHATYHAMPERRCWTYAPMCVRCDQPTDLGAGFRWAPWLC